MFPFNQHVGPQVLVPCSSVGAFFLFFTRALLEYIVLQSNKYAFECMGGEKYEKWEKITIDELTAFMGFMLFIGIVRLPLMTTGNGMRSPTMLLLLEEYLETDSLRFSGTSTLLTTQP